MAWISRFANDVMNTTRSIGYAMVSFIVIFMSGCS